jgi:hypothetical protein
MLVLAFAARAYLGQKTPISLLSPESQECPPL